MAVAVRLGIAAVAPFVVRGRIGGALRRRRGLLRVALYEFVELSPVEPDAATLGTIIDLHPLPLAHHERNTTDGARHADSGIGHGGSPEASPRGGPTSRTTERGRQTGPARQTPLGGRGERKGVEERKRGIE